MEQNQDLFADDHASLGQLVDRLGGFLHQEHVGRFAGHEGCDLVGGGPDEAQQIPADDLHDGVT